MYVISTLFFHIFSYFFFIFTFFIFYKEDNIISNNVNTLYVIFIIVPSIKNSFVRKLDLNIIRHF